MIPQIHTHTYAYKISAFLIHFSDLLINVIEKIATHNLHIISFTALHLKNYLVQLLNGRLNFKSNPTEIVSANKIDCLDPGLPKK